MKFKFNGRVCDEFGITVTKIKDVTSGMSREIIKGSKTKYRAVSNHWGTKYNEDLVFTICIMKDPCVTKYNEMRFTSSEIRAISSWLTSPQYPQSLKIFSEYYKEDIEYFAIINDITVDDDGYIYELMFSVECNAPYGFSQEYKHEISIPYISTLNIHNTSDDYETYVYPKIEIMPTAHGMITITSVTDKREISFSALKNNKIIIDSERRKFLDSTGVLLTFEDIGIEDVDQIYFPKLHSGKNELQFSGSAEITITYREPRKVGVFN